MDSGIKIEISKFLFEKIQANIDKLGFTSVEECIEFVMNEFFLEFKEKDNSEKLKENDEKQLKERLRSLGYLE